jgi:hypothetical protein
LDQAVSGFTQQLIQWFLGAVKFDSVHSPPPISLLLVGSPRAFVSHSRGRFFQSWY